MTMKERDKLRKLQDRVVKRLEKKGYKEDDIITHAWEGPVTLGKIRTQLYPKLEWLFKDFLHD